MKKLRSTALSTTKLKKKGIEKQFEANSQDLDHVQSASSFLAVTPPQVEEALEELREAFQNPYTGSQPISSPGLRGRSCFACGTFAVHFRSQCPVLNYQPSANRPNKLPVRAAHPFLCLSQSFLFSMSCRSFFLFLAEEGPDINVIALLFNLSILG